MANKGVRQGLSKLNQTRKALPTAADYRTGQEGEGSGFGGSFSGRSVRGVSKALGAQGKEFEDSTSKKMKGAGRNRPQEVVQRGRELDSDGKPIEKRRDTSFKGALGKMVDRATMTTDKKTKKPKPEEPKSKVTATEPKGGDPSAAKVTSGKGVEKVEAQSGGKSKGTGTRKIRVAPDRESSQQERMPRQGERLDAKTGKRIYVADRGRPKGSKNKPKTEKEPKVTTLDGESKVKTDSKKKQGEGLGSKVGKGLQSVGKSAADAVGKGLKSAGKAAKDGAVKVGKGIKDEVVSGAKELSKDIENKVAAGKKKRDETREKTKVKVTTNYTKPKKGEEMKVPEKKDKVTVSTSKDTTKDREKQKKQAPQALAQAVARRSEADAAKDAVKDMRQSGEKVTDDVRAQLNKTVAKTDSDPKASTQLKGVKDNDLIRSTTPSDDEGSFRRGASRTKKTINPNAPKSTGKKTVKKKLNTNKNKKKEEASESFSHWREEFIWETDKKYPEKVKEIKPMTGKNTITINPEDETSKYKRGY